VTLADLLDKDSLRFLLFGGKGGVGKTSCAAATGLWAAEHGRETLVISTDPAHSLGDSFDQNLSGGDVKPIQGVRNLYGLEINPQKALAELQMAQQREMAQAPPGMDSAMMGLVGPEGLVDMAVPGLDEALAFSKVLEFVHRECDYDLVVFDTAPTGHTLRLLGLPEALDSFLGKLIKLRIRLSNLFSRLKSIFGAEAQTDQTLEYLERLKETISAVRVELSDPNRTSFVIVLIPEAMAVDETERLLQALYEFQIPSDHMVINMVYPEIPDCTFCRARKKMQESHLERIRFIYDDFNITEVPLFRHEVRGLSTLRFLGTLLVTGKHPDKDAVNQS